MWVELGKGWQKSCMESTFGPAERSSGSGVHTSLIHGLNTGVLSDTIMQISEKLRIFRVHR